MDFTLPGPTKAMCGRFSLVDNPQIQWLCEVLGVNLEESHISGDIAPGSPIAIIHEKGGERQVSEAIWWLLLDPNTLKPNYKYASFNSRSDKLNKRSGISYQPYRESRCLIPASAFVEGLGDKKTYHMIELEDSAIAFGGLYKEYLNRETGEVVYAASIITLPPLTPEWDEICPKSMPLMIDFEDEALVSKWLDPDFHNVDEFEHLLKPKVTKPMIVTKIGKPSKWDPIEDSFMIVAEQTRNAPMTNEQIAAALFTAFEQSDMETVRALCAPGFRARQNLNTEFDIETLIQFSQAVSAVVKNFRYTDITRSATESGFVEEHLVCGDLSDGSELKIAACVVADIVDGKITHLREYVDSAAATGLRQALA